MATYLFKTEPEDYSLGDLQRAGEVRWDGIRNYGARNRLQECVPGDLVLVYHSGKNPGIVGTARIATTPYADPTQFDPTSDYFDPKSAPDSPRWWSVDIAFVEAWDVPVSLATMKATTELAELEVLKRQRLSVSIVADEELDVILRLRETRKS